MKRYERWLIALVLTAFAALMLITCCFRAQADDFLDRQWHDPDFTRLIATSPLNRDTSGWTPPPHMRVPAGMSIYDACMHPSRPSTPAGTP